MIETNTRMDSSRVRSSVHVSGRRFFALIIDMICYSLLMGIIDAVFGVLQVTSGSPLPTRVNLLPTYTAVTLIQWPGGHLLWSLLLMLLYFLVQEALFGTTLGKSIVGLRVVGLNGERLTLKAALVRNMLRLVDILPGPLLTITIGPFGIPAIYIVGAVVIWSSSLRQRLGDQQAQTLVVKAEAAPQAALPRFQILTRLFCVVIALMIFFTFSANFYYNERPPLVIEGWKSTNTDLFRVEGGVASYSLGTPAWSDDLVFYPVQFITNDGRQCSGEFTLRWSGWINGWYGVQGHYSCNR